MKRKPIASVTVALVAVLGSAFLANAAGTVLQGKDAFGDYTRDAPGVWHKITVGDLPKPFETESARTGGRPMTGSAGEMPNVMPGFQVSVYAKGFKEPREIKTAPNGDIFLAESGADKIHVLRANGQARPPTDTVFADVAERPFGISFFPAGPHPDYVYIASTREVVRFPYAVGDTKARGPKEVIVPNLPGGGHWTRDVLTTPDSKRILVAIGSSSNIADRGMEAEQGRANILAFNPDGSGRNVVASGLRNPVAIAFNPVDNSLWTSVNERDLLGDNLPADYVTHVQPGKFYGWPYFYNGDHADPRVKGMPPVPGNQVVVGDVLIQPHSAPLGIAFYTGKQFPAEYQNDLFVALHGSWNRGLRTGYKLIRVKMENGKATGQYEDFVTGFVNSGGNVWGRPVGVAVAQDGALLMSDDGSGTIWRISYSGAKQVTH